MTNVAPKKPLAEHGFFFVGEVAFEFDGQVGNALAGIDLTIVRDGVCWAEVDASRASAAVILKVGGVVIEVAVEQ